MESFKQSIKEYKKQIEKEMIQKAYRGLMEYILGLKTHLGNKYPDYLVSGSIYAGYMDMTYFSFTPKSLVKRKLKIAIVFLHDAFKFEAWLAGANKQVQNQYWKLFNESGWDKYRIPASIKGIDSIMEHTLADNPDFGNLDTLTGQIESETLAFISDAEDFLSRH